MPEVTPVGHQDGCGGVARENVDATGPDSPWSRMRTTETLDIGVKIESAKTRNAHHPPDIAVCTWSEGEFRENIETNAPQHSAQAVVLVVLFGHDGLHSYRYVH